MSSSFRLERYRAGHRGSTWSSPSIRPSLAGALGKDVWVLLPFDTGWRWMTGRDDTPWCPTTPRFWRPAPGDWDGPFSRVLEALAYHSPATPTTMSQPARAVSDLERGVMIFREAVAQHRRQDLVGAERLYREAIVLHPEIAEAHNNLGAVLGDTDRKDEALAAFAKAVELKPEYGEALNNLGLLHCGKGEASAAIDYLERAVRTSPTRVDWLNNLGNAYLEQLRIEDAIRAYAQAIALDPSFIFARNNHAVALRGLGRYDESIGELEALIAQQPEYFEAINNLGLALRDSGRREEAIPVFERAIALAPGATEPIVNLGVTWQEMGRHEEARHQAARLLTLDPASHDAYDIYGHCAYEEGDYDAAYELFGRAIELRPDDVNAQWNRALLDLHRGRLREGFAGYEWRRKLVAFARNLRSPDTPEWDGSPIVWQSILVISEQGLGDALQFVRYATALKDAGAGAVHVECDPALVDLIRSVPAVDSVVPRGQRLPEHDVHVYMLSLPGLLGTDDSNIPAKVPYLTAPVRSAADAVAEDGLAIGFVWAGSPGHSRDHIRSARLDLFESLFSVPGTTFHSLQKGGPEKALAGDRWSNVRDLSDRLDDFGDTAAVIERLDLVITVDTSVAHLAGALGKRTWLLLPYVCDFRWMTEGETSPWYPSMRIFRQPAPTDWESVFDHVRRELMAPAGRSSIDTQADAPVTEMRAFQNAEANELAALATGAEVTESSVQRISGSSQAGLQTFAVAGAGLLDPEEQPVPDSDFHDAVRELLQDGDTFIDANPGSGGLVLAAMAGRARPLAKVLAIADPEEAGLLRELLAAEAIGPVDIQESSYPEDKVHLVGMQLLRSERALVAWGANSHILATPAGRSTLASSRLAGIFWHTAGLDAPLVANLLSAAGFDHFRVERDEEGVMLEAISDPTAERMIVSLHSSRLDEFRGDSSEHQDHPATGRDEPHAANAGTVTREDSRHEPIPTGRIS